jgi:hypothetical protein
MGERLASATVSKPVKKPAQKLSLELQNRCSIPLSYGRKLQGQSPLRTRITATESASLWRRMKS